MEPLTVRRMVSARIPTDEAEFHLNLFHNNHDDKEHLAIVLGDVAGKSEVLVRLHSECFTGDVLGSRRRTSRKARVMAASCHWYDCDDEYCALAGVTSTAPWRVAGLGLVRRRGRRSRWVLVSVRGGGARPRDGRCGTGASRGLRRTGSL